jgi:predicted homoserine dehydrogenase-like protein
MLLDADIDVVVEATGNPIAGTGHALRAIGTGKHVVMVTVEADVLAGPALAKRAEQAGAVYSMAYGDQPALIMELVDWARTAGFEVVCAGKGKASIEMAAVANAAGLVPSDDGLTFTPGNVEEIATICRPASAGGVLAHEGSVEVMSSVTRAGERIPFNIQEGVFVVVKATNRYVSGCFTEYAWHPDPSGRYAALYRPYHYIGLELNISSANAVLRGIPTGSPIGFYGDVVATAKRDLAAHESLDGEGGYTVWGKLVSARTSVRERLLPVGLARHVELKNAVPKGQAVRWDDIDIDSSLATALELRRETEALAPPGLPDDVASIDEQVDAGHE